MEQPGPQAVASPSPGVPRQVGAAEARQLVAAGAVEVLDVRTPNAYAAEGHIPESRLLPFDVIASAPAILPKTGKPLLVCGEHGAHGDLAARFLVAAGLGPVLNMTDGMAAWRGPRAFGDGRVLGPSSWVVRHADLIRRGARVLDVACGRGRHALWLASRGCRVTAVDRDTEAIAELTAVADRVGYRLDAIVVDLEATPEPFGSRQYDVVVVVHYLHRPLFPALVRAVAPRGLLLYETFTTDQARRGHPTNPAYLLRPGELKESTEPLTIVRAREGDYEGRMVASVAARRRMPRPTG